MNRRQLLKGLIGGAIALPLIEPIVRTIFLPPRGGWITFPRPTADWGTPPDAQNSTPEDRPIQSSGYARVAVTASLSSWAGSRGPIYTPRSNQRDMMQMLSKMHSARAAR